MYNVLLTIYPVTISVYDINYSKLLLVATQLFAIVAMTKCPMLASIQQVEFCYRHRGQNRAKIPNIRIQFEFV